MTLTEMKLPWLEILISMRVSCEGNNTALSIWGFARLYMTNYDNIEASKALQHSLMTETESSFMIYNLASKVDK